MAKRNSGSRRGSVPSATICQFPTKPNTLSQRRLSEVPLTVSRDTIEALKELLAGAMRGEVTGIGYCAMYRSRYVVDATGVVRDSPTFARGMVAELSDALHQMIQ